MSSRLKATHEPEEKLRTQMDYFLAIEQTGGLLFSTRRGINRGLLKDSPAQRRHLKDLAQQQRQYGQIIEEKWGIIVETQESYDPVTKKLLKPPPGKRWYGPWYRRMKRQWLTGEFDKTICGACPLLDRKSIGHTGHDVPCSVFPGIIHQVVPVWQCSMLGDFKDWTEEQLLTAIRTKVGPGQADAAVQRFLEHQRELITVSDKKRTS